MFPGGGGGGGGGQGEVKFTQAAAEGRTPLILMDDDVKCSWVQ